MMREMCTAFDLVDADDAVRAVIVTGSGERAFCAGADLTPDAGGDVFASRSEVESLSDERVRDSGGRLTLRIFQCKKPVIGAINGAAVGIGATMQLPMDFRLASDTARIGFVDAVEALNGGLVRSVHAPTELMEAARALAREIADNTAPVSIALTRAMLWRLSAAEHPMAAHAIDSRAIYRRSRSGDAKEGIASFLEKRSPAYPDQVSTDLPDFFPWWDEPVYK
jgi:enoyl-CoA hydratase/carnithine racemase